MVTTYQTTPHKVDLLREFRNYPPTVLLGAFDYMRAIKEPGQQAASHKKYEP